MSIRPRAGAMHELALSQRIVALVLERARAERLRTVTRVAVAVGAAAGVDPEALRFCFDVVVAETMAREAELVIERVRLRARCRSCRQEFEPTTRLAPCPACQRTGTDLQSALVEARAQLQTAVAARAQAKAQATAAEAALESARVDVDFREAPCGRPPRASSGSRRNIDDSTLKSPIFGRVQVKVAEPGEVLAAGGRVFNLIDLTDVYMTFFLPTATAGLVALEAEVRTVLDAAPQFIYLVVHQPRRLNLPAQPIPSGATARNIERCLFDSALDERYFRKVARTCYWPATERFLDLACQLPAEVHARHGRFLTAGEAIAAHGAESHHLPLPVFPASWADSVQRELEDRLLGAVAEKELEAV